MLFNSLQFLFFFGVVTILYFQLPHKSRWILLLLSSCYFYMAFVPVYILILGATIVIDFFAGILLEKAEGKLRKIFLIVSLFANIGVLCVFKYYNFINLNLTNILVSGGINNPLPYLSILLPIGLSFHTFQAMSYTIEVYRGKQKAERNFFIYALYVMFYPQLVAGPIERPQNILHQFYDKHDFDYGKFKSGIMLMAFGFFKKVVIADRLAGIVDNCYQNVESATNLSIAIATFFYAFQIYCDFSGYSEIAIGAARVMGFDLMENFRTPYFSKSISEFWTRWHISLSTWFRDYLYIPLGGNRVSLMKWYRNILVVFIISGLWHGANWTFIIWGALHGCFLIFTSIRDRVARNYKWSLPDGLLFKGMQIVITFLMIDFAWIFFRSPNLQIALRVVGKIFDLSQYNTSITGFNWHEFEFAIALLFVLILKERFYNKISAGKDAVFYPLLTVIVIVCYLFGVFNRQQFIYFQF